MYLRSKTNRIDICLRLVTLSITLKVYFSNKYLKRDKKLKKCKCTYILENANRQSRYFLAQAQF